MSTVTKNKANKLPDPPFGSTPWGNTTKALFNFTTNASGVLVASNQATAVASGDKVILGVLNAGMQLTGAMAIISDAGTASTTMDVGFEYVDGVDDATVPEDADYFFDGTATSAQARIAADNVTVAPVILAKDAYLTLTVGGATHASACVVDLVIEGVLTGAK